MIRAIFIYLVYWRAIDWMLDLQKIRTYVLIVVLLFPFTMPYRHHVHQIQQITDSVRSGGMETAATNLWSTEFATKKHTVFHQFLKFAAQSDLVSPLASLFQDVANGPSEIFMVAKTAGWSTFDLRDLLQWYGIKVWGLFLRDDCITFRVRRAQARFTCHVLLDEQIEFTTTWRGQERPKPRHEQQPAEQPGLLQRLEQWLDTL